MQISPKIYGTSPDGFIPALAIAHFLENKEKILVIGDYSKRDYLMLKNLQKEVFLIDIVSINGVENFTQQSITEKTSFPDAFFDGIVLAEVIEHLFEDKNALEEIHRILKPDGTLIITVPYFSNEQDAPEYHVRVHSQKTIRRLLEYTGFKIEDHFFRGMMVRSPQKNKASKLFTFGCSKLLRMFYGQEKGLSFFQKVWFNLEYFLGTKKIFLPLQKRCISFGGIMKITKNQKKDFLAIQKESFQP